MAGSADRDARDRGAHIASIIDAIGDGTYRVDDLEVADAVLKRWHAFDVLSPDSPPGDQETDQPASAEAASSEASSR
jgi:hypothetical protein